MKKYKETQEILRNTKIYMKKYKEVQRKTKSYKQKPHVIYAHQIPQETQINTNTNQEMHTCYVEQAFSIAIRSQRFKFVKCARS